MRLGLSSDADSQATLDELVSACGRRGLVALELRVPGGAPVSAGVAGAAGEWLQGAAALHTGLPDVAALLVDTLHADPVAERCAGMGTPLVLAGDASPAERRAAATRLVAAGHVVYPLMEGPASSWLDDALAAGVPVAWQIDGTCTDPGRDLRGILEQRGLLAYVRLVGGGPEATEQGGRGIGAAMTRLAVSGYSGPLILTPSSRRYRVIWSTWLGRRGGWGCGSKVAAS